MFSLLRQLLIVPALFFCTVAIGLSIPPVPGFAVDVQPRIVSGEVKISIANAALASGGIQALAIVSATGVLIEDIKPRLNYAATSQEIFIQTKEWARGMYILVVADNSNRGIIKILKLD